MLSDIAESLALVGIDDNTRAVLREAWPAIREGVPYALRIAFAPTLGAIGGGPTQEQIEAAREGQNKHWEALFAAKFDEEYARSLRQVAMIHAQVGLAPRWLISGYVTTLTELHSLIVGTQCTSSMTWGARSRLERTIRAVDQAVLFDLQLCVTAYTEQLNLMARERLHQISDQFESPAAKLMETLMTSTPESRTAASDLFVAAQRRTSGATAPDAPAPAPAPAPEAREVANDALSPRRSFAQGGAPFVPVELRSRSSHGGGSAMTAGIPAGMAQYVPA